MLLGLNAKNRKDGSVHVDYLIHIQEIKPWPPSQSLRSLRSVLIQWENGDRSSGSTKTVVPSLGSVVGEGRIEFIESFRLPVTLLREMNIKNKDTATFQKNCLEFNLYEPRREKTTLLANATIDLSDYGIVKEALSVNVPMNSKRSFKNTAQPVLFIKIQPVDKAIGRTGFSLRDGLSKEASLDKNGGESVSALMNEEYAEEAEVASFTVDDFSSHSSHTVSCAAAELNNGLLPRNEENGSVKLLDSMEVKKEQALASELPHEKSNTKAQITSHENLKGCSSRSSSIDLSSELESRVNGHASVSDSSNTSPFISNNVVAYGVDSSPSSFTNEHAEEGASTCMRSNDCEHLVQGVHNTVPNGKSVINGDAEQNCGELFSNRFPMKVTSMDDGHLLAEKIGFTSSGNSQVNKEVDGKTWRTAKSSMEEAAHLDDDCNSFIEDMERNGQDGSGVERGNSDEERHSTGDEAPNFYSQDASRNQVSLGMRGNILKSDRIKHAKSVRSYSDAARSNGLFSNNHHKEVKENGVLEDVQNISGSFKSNERINTKVYAKDTRSAIVESKIQQLECKVKMLEAELREAAAAEVALYSVVAEHGSSMSKVHAPARRLSRLFLHACKESSQSRRASAARSVISGLVLVAKACGNDVPRLTFWLSNSVVLRAIISQATEGLELPFSAGRSIERSNGQRENSKISFPLKWKESSPSKKQSTNFLHGGFGDLEDPHTFSSALEKVEAWIFTRIVESIWWQTLTPHMQSATAKAIDKDVGSDSRKNFARTCSSGDQDQGNFSLDHWKQAFKDACERLCPVRAGGHECGCLRLLAKLIMEQCVARLDVAMFNAILRESTDDIPTDPVSDPVSDSKVLPIPAGKSSFGAGAQLKHAIGNWSRWLSDLFGMDDDDALGDENDCDINDERQDTSFKSFHLLNALSDLMMLPKDMLLSRSIRKEVCPTFAAPLIKRVLDNFVPDEFCPDPIPDIVLEALDSEDPLEAEEESITSFPCVAAPPHYSPPSAATIASAIGEVGNQSEFRRSGSSVLRKSYTSDDELDELNSPSASVFIDCLRSSPVSTRPSWISEVRNNQNAVRYTLLRDIWMNCE